MAWINGEWIQRIERAEIIETYRDYIGMLDAQYPDIDDMPSDILADYFDKARELERLERIHRCENDSYEFALEYFSETRNPGNDGNWEGFDIKTKEDAPDFHREMTEIIDDVSTVNTNAKIAIAAPRSHAKSTWFTKDKPIKEVVYRKRKYIIIISETPTVATANMEWIRNQLKFNRKLREDFGPLLSPKDQSNIKDNGEEFIAWHPDGIEGKRQLTLVQAASTGQALRGRNWNGSRPDLIICDDLEDARPGGNASTPEQRVKLRDWFSQTVMALGDPKGVRTAFIVVGTTVHFDSLLMNILYDRSDFKTKVYRAIIDEPIRGDLWEKCRQVYIERENPNRKEDAIQFYDDNEEELLRGCAVLWGEVQPILKLMMWKWDNGSKAFNTEYQNNPIDEESMIFNPDTFTYWSVLDINPKDYLITMGVDFAFGREKGDFSAITIVARHKENGIIYIADSYLERLPVDEFFEVVVEKVNEWQPDFIAADANAAQEFLAQKLQERLVKENYPAMSRLKHIKNRTKKELRIEAMKPDIENGTIRFNKSHAKLLEQFERYGQKWHDDGPDSMQMAISTVIKSIRRKAGYAGSYRY